MRYLLFTVLFLFSSISFLRKSWYVLPLALSIIGLIASIVLSRYLIKREGWRRGLTRIENIWNKYEASVVVPLGVLVFIVCCAINQFILRPIPHIQDGFAYYYQAKVFASGHLWGQVSSLPEFFPCPWVIIHEGRQFSVFPPGWSLLLAIGIKLGVPWIINPLLGMMGFFYNILLSKRDLLRYEGKTGGTIMRTVSIFSFYVCWIYVSPLLSAFFVPYNVLLF